MMSLISCYHVIYITISSMTIAISFILYIGLGVFTLILMMSLMSCYHIIYITISSMTFDISFIFYIGLGVFTLIMMYYTHIPAHRQYQNQHPHQALPFTTTLIA